MSSFAGTAALVRLALRRDRVLLPVWILVFAGTAASSASATVDLYPDASDRIEAASNINDVTALVALYGRVYDPTSLGAVSLIKLIGFGAAMVALLSMILVVRHTRAEEEAGRLELVGAAVVGRCAALTAALLVTTGASVAIGGLSAFGLIGSGLPVAGSVAFGLMWAATGVAFAAVAAVAAQLATGARAAVGLTAAVLGAAYLLRAAGDGFGGDEPRWLSWLSPIGWAQQVRPYAGNRWAVLLLLAVFTAAGIAAAYALLARRDAGAGLLADRPGPAGGAASLRSPLALAWRLHRATLAGWAASFLVLGTVLGSLAGNVADLASSKQSQDFFTKLGGEKGLADAFLATEMGFLSVIVAVYGVAVAMRLRSEETALHAEQVLATSVGRLRWAASHLAIALLGSTALVVVGGLAAGVTRSADAGAGQIGRLLGAALVQLPAAWVVTAIVVAGFGLAPRLAAAGWVALVAFVLLGEFGPVFSLDQTVMDASPFAHTPKLPGSALSATPLLWLLAVAAALAAAGLAGFRRRDVG